MTTGLGLAPLKVEGTTDERLQLEAEVMENFMATKEGIKHDEGKPRIDLIPPEAIFAMGEVLSFGAIVEGYGERNWEAGMDWGRVFGATMRHLWKWWGGEINDPKSGKPHSWHAITNIAFLIAYESRTIGKDSRNKIYGPKKDCPSK